MFKKGSKTSSKGGQRQIKEVAKTGPRHDRTKKEATTGFNVGSKQIHNVDQYRSKVGTKTD